MQPYFSEDPNSTITFALRFDKKALAFVLSSQKGDKLCPIAAELAKLDEPPFPLRYAVTQAASLKIHPQDLHAVRSWLQAASERSKGSILCQADQLSQSAKIGEVPECAVLTVTGGVGNLCCSLPPEIVSLSDNGWFLSGSKLFELPLSPTTMLALQQSLFGNLLVDWLRVDLPELTKRGICLRCPFRFDDSPYVRIRVLKVKDEEIVLQKDNTAKALVPEPGTDGKYLWDGSTLRPYQHDAGLDNLFSPSDKVILRGEMIPAFMIKAQNDWKSLLSDRVQELLDLHRVYENAEFVLVAYSEKQNGIGRALARVELEADGKRFSALTLSHAMQAGKAYVSGKPGWFSASLLESIGLGRMGRLSDGRSIEKPFLLTPEELFRRGSDRLRGPWKRMEVDFHQDQKGQSRSLSHLRFLIEWGLSGGLIGCENAQLDALVAVLREQVLSPSCQILIVCRKQRLNELLTKLHPLSAQCLDVRNDVVSQNKSGFPVIATTNYLLNTEAFPLQRVDLLILLEPDEMTRTSHTKLYPELMRIKAGLRIALYQNGEFLQRFDTKFAQQSLLGQRGGAAAEHLVIDGNKPPQPLPRPFDFARSSQEQEFAEIELSADSAAASEFAIPRRTEPPLWLNKSIRSSSGRFQSGEAQFVEQAKRFTQKTVSAARFVAFAAYWPTYASMSASQSQWYFYWRGKVRQGDFPPTDLSYIFLYVYELINLVGVDSPVEGFQKLISVWRAYRGTYPRLNRYLYAWVQDFALVHRLDTTGELKEFDCMSAGEADIDRLLLQKLSETPLRLNVALLVKVSNYDLTRSKFYRRKNVALCEEYVPKTVALVDAYLLRQQGQRIVDLFRPEEVQREHYLFQSALYAEEPRILTINVVPLSTHPPLRDFIAQLIRYTENWLRSYSGFSGKLRGIDLDESLKRLIDGYLDRELNAVSTAPRNIVIDYDKLVRAKEDAKLITKMLMVDSPDDNEDAIIPSTEALPYVSPVHSASEWEEDVAGLQPMEALFSRLDQKERVLINILSKNGFEMEQKGLGAALPSIMTEQAIDAINEKALQTLGSLLIVFEKGSLLIDEDYRHELSLLSKEAPNKQSAEFPASLPIPWKELASSLSPIEIDMLHAFLRGEDPFAQQLIAERAGTMVEPMLDHINELSMDTIGDILIENGTILLEYQTFIGQLCHTEEK